MNSSKKNEYTQAMEAAVRMLAKAEAMARAGKPKAAQMYYDEAAYQTRRADLYVGLVRR